MVAHARASAPARRRARFLCRRRPLPAGAARRPQSAVRPSSRPTDAPPAGRRISRIIGIDQYHARMADMLTLQILSDSIVYDVDRTTLASRGQRPAAVIGLIVTRFGRRTVRPTPGRMPPELLAGDTIRPTPAGIRPRSGPAASDHAARRSPGR